MINQDLANYSSLLSRDVYHKLKGTRFKEDLGKNCF